MAKPSTLPGGQGAVNWADQGSAHATPHFPDLDSLLAAAPLAPEHPAGPGEHFPPDASADLSQAVIDTINEHASNMPDFVSDWLLA